MRQLLPNVIMWLPPSLLWLAFSFEAGQTTVMFELPEDLGIRSRRRCTARTKGTSSRLWSRAWRSRGSRLNTLDPQRVKASILIVCDDILLLVSLLQVFPLTFE